MLRNSNVFRLRLVSVLTYKILHTTYSIHCFVKIASQNFVLKIYREIHNILLFFLFTPVKYLHLYLFGRGQVFSISDSSIPLKIKF